jgi:hypothetical protein
MLCILEVAGLNSVQGLTFPTEDFVVVLNSSRQLPGKLLKPDPLLSTSSTLHYSPYRLMAYSLSC